MVTAYSARQGQISCGYLLLCVVSRTAAPGILRGVCRLLLGAFVFLVVAGLTLFLEALTVVIIAGEVSCYEVCSPTSEFLDAAAPLPGIVGLLLALLAGWGATRLLLLEDHRR